jgi:hypothetical protein
MEKCLISIRWPVRGIHSLLDGPKETKCNRAFRTDVVIPSLIENITSRSRRKPLQGWVIHMDKTCTHTSRSSQECIRASKAEWLPHRAYGPTLLWVTSSSLGVPKQNSLIRIVRAGPPLEDGRRNFQSNSQSNVDKCLRILDKGATVGDKTQGAVRH